MISERSMARLRGAAGSAAFVLAVAPAADPALIAATGAETTARFDTDLATRQAFYEAAAAVSSWAPRSSDSRARVSSWSSRRRGSR